MIAPCLGTRVTAFRQIAAATQTFHAALVAQSRQLVAAWSANRSYKRATRGTLRPWCLDGSSCATIGRCLLPRRMSPSLVRPGASARSALEVIAASEGRLTAVALSAHGKLEQLVGAGTAISAAVGRGDRRSGWLARSIGRRCRQERSCWLGRRRWRKWRRPTEVDVVLAAIVGSAGLRSTWAALEAKKTVALANKETLVMAGGLVTRLAAERGATILPVDSEHSAIFQALQAGRHDEVRRIVLTASGGPFRELSLEQLKQVTVDDALAHPTWDMGPKITVDSATMMNKALEIIESRWLFDLTAEQIEVVIHPQSIVHSFVEFVDGSVIAQLGPPDMKLPIQYALEYPHRQTGIAERLDWRQRWRLEFEPADPERCPALALGYECAPARRHERGRAECGQ